MATQPTNNFDFQNFYSATLQADITAGSLTLTLDTVPTPTEGILIIEPDSATNREIIFYTGKGASTVTLPSDGRGWDSSTAVAHLTGSTVIMAPVAYMLRMLKSGSLFDTTQTGWTALGTTATYSATNGNHSYNLTSAVDKSTVLSKGMRIKFDRVTPAPTQCTSLNGTTQYYSKASPAGMTFTNNFVVSAWVKLTSYPASDAMIASRHDGTNGWFLDINSSGQLFLNGTNGAAGNYNRVVSYQSVPLNKWVHVAAQLDMTSATVTGGTNNYVMLDGVDVPCFKLTGGTAPSALIQAGNLNIGTYNSGAGGFFPGKIAQVAIYSAKVTEATILASMNQGLAGTETSLISAYSFNNSINDLNANANNLTANGSAVATNADSPFAQGSTTGVTEYGIVMAISGTSITLQTPEGSCVPATGTMTNFYYSPHKAPYGMPVQKGKWVVGFVNLAQQTQGTATTATWYNVGSASLTVPIGEWNLGYSVSPVATASAAQISINATLSTANNSASDAEFVTETAVASPTFVSGNLSRTRSRTMSVSTPYYLNLRATGTGTINIYSANNSTVVPSLVEAENALL